MPRMEFPEFAPIQFSRRGTGPLPNASGIIADTFTRMVREFSAKKAKEKAIAQKEAEDQKALDELFAMVDDSSAKTVEYVRDIDLMDSQFGEQMARWKEEANNSQFNKVIRRGAPDEFGMSEVTERAYTEDEYVTLRLAEALVGRGAVDRETALSRAKSWMKPKPRVVWDTDKVQNVTRMMQRRFGLSAEQAEATFNSLAGEENPWTTGQLDNFKVEAGNDAYREFQQEDRKPADSKSIADYAALAEMQASLTPGMGARYTRDKNPLAEGEADFLRSDARLTNEDFRGVDFSLGEDGSVRLSGGANAAKTKEIERIINSNPRIQNAERLKMAGAGSRRTDSEAGKVMKAQALSGMLPASTPPSVIPAAKPVVNPLDGLPDPYPDER